MPSGAVVSSDLTESFPLAICKAALMTVIEEEAQDAIYENVKSQIFKLFLSGGLNMQKKDERWFKLLISCLSFFIIGLFLLFFCIFSLGEKVRRDENEREALKKFIEKIQIMQNLNRDFTRDVFKQRAIALCFRELIIDYEQKYTSEEIQDCIQLILVADEKYGNKGIDAPMIFAWLQIESDGNPQAISWAGAKGLTQLMDFRAKEEFIKMGYPGYDEKLVFNPVINLKGGLNHLDRLMSFWKRSGIKNQSLVLFYAIHSYKWGSDNTGMLFNTDKSEFRPAIKYVDWILNRREYWAERLKYLIDNPQKRAKERSALLGRAEYGGE